MTMNEKETTIADEMEKRLREDLKEKGLTEQEIQERVDAFLG